MSGEPEPNITIIVFTRNKQQTTFRKQSLKLIILDNQLGKFDNPRGHLKKFVKAEGHSPRASDFDPFSASPTQPGAKSIHTASSLWGYIVEAVYNSLGRSADVLKFDFSVIVARSLEIKPVSQEFLCQY